MWMDPTIFEEAPPICGSGLGGMQVRKIQQTQILEFLRTLREAKDELDRQTSWDVLQDLFADMQEFALQIGRYIEETTAGEGIKAVSLLEEFCDTVYEAYQNQDVFSYSDRLGSQLIHIENTVKEELRPDRIEVVFFSYQLSMWDSLESVYLAAKADPHCDVYVVPIPWFDRLPNGDLGEMHYDGGQYPGDIPITNWKEYDVEARHPDIIYIHNPYDEGNYVTSVHPDFYSKRLRSLTDLLVYIPYFIGTDNIEERFCVTAACVYAHKTIVQSEKIRELYIKAFRKAYGNQLGNPEDRFVALGSPKLDALLNANPEDFDLPGEWRDLIYNEDGTKKKIVLYNTSVSAILQWNERHLEKLRFVFDTLRERNDVVLWWRPHPLSEVTYQSMRPHLLDEYKDLVSEYMGDGRTYRPDDENPGEKKGRGNFIFDRSGDLHRAIAMSSCYYGDGSSSLVALYQATGKPIMLQNVNMTRFSESDLEEFRHSDVIFFGNQVVSIEDLKNSYPDFYAYWLPYFNKFAQSHAVCISDYSYGLSSFFNAVYKTDYRHAKANFLMSFPSEDVFGWLYHMPCRIGNKLIFIPCRSRKWAFYHLEEKEWSYEEVPKSFYPSEKWRAAFGGMVLFGDSLIIGPGESGAIAKYCLCSGEITYYTEWFEHLRKHIKNIDWGILSGLLPYNDTLLLVSPQTNLVFQLNPTTMEIIKTHIVGSGACGFRTAYLIPNSDTVYFIKMRDPENENVQTEIATQLMEIILKWNVKTGETQEITNLPIHTSGETKQNLLNGFTFWKDVLYITPLQGDTILKLNIETDEITRWPLTPPFDFFRRKSTYYEGWAKDQALPYVVFNGERMKFTVQLPYDYSLAEVDFETGEITNKRKWYVEGAEELFRCQGKTAENLLVENVNYTMTDFLDDVCAGRKTVNGMKKDERDAKSFAVVDGIAGKKIFDFTKVFLIKMG